MEKKVVSTKAYKSILLDNGGFGLRVETFADGSALLTQLKPTEDSVGIDPNTIPALIAALTEIMEEVGHE